MGRKVEKSIAVNVHEEFRVTLFNEIVADEKGIHMAYYFVSDLHVDFYCPETCSMRPLLKAFEQFYVQNFLPAEVCGSVIPLVTRTKIPIRKMV